MNRFYFDVYLSQNDVKKVYVDSCYKQAWMIRQELKEIYKNAIIVLTNIVAIY